MTYKEAIEFLYDSLPVFHRIGKAAYKGDLNNTKALDNYFGNPHTKFKSIHVAGTNGKGSVSHMLASILMESGLKTALYTSPHLKDFRERIMIDSVLIPEEEVITFVVKHRAFIESLRPSFFELTVAMAYDWFARSGVDVAVIETGLGGRLDSTNIITPMLSVITNIGLEHTGFLGDTIEKIAREKAGIIKRNVPVVIGESSSATMPVFMAKAQSLAAELFVTDKNYGCEWIEDLNIKREYRSYKATRVLSGGDKQEFEGEIPLYGDYQLKNVRTVLHAFDILRRGLGLNPKNFLDGVRKVKINTHFRGRFEIIGTEPLIICDTGHNMEGLEYTLGQIKDLNRDKLHCVIGFSDDKDLDRIFPLFPRDALYYFTRADIERSADPQKLMEAAYEYGLYGKTYSSVSEGFAAAKANSGEEDMIFVGGSIFVIAEII